MIEEDIHLDVYIDGSSFRNPGHEGGIAAIACFSDDRNPKVLFRENLKQTTNNRAELLAVIKTVQQVRSLAKRERIGSFTIWTDSQYVYENRFRPAYWRNSGWVNRDGRIIENQDLWKKLLSLQSWGGLPFGIQWNKGKTTDVLKQVDKLAKSAAKSPLSGRDYGYRPGRVAQSKGEDKGAPSLFPAANQNEIIRIYGYELKKAKKKKEYKIKFDLFSEEEKRLATKYFAYLAIVDSEERMFHRHHFYSVTFNDNPRHPLIEELIECDNPLLD